jgi:DNA-binding MarR family transcriptional regulator
MRRTVESCAREVLATVPVVMRFIRDQVRRGRVTGLSLPQFRALTFLDRVKDSSLSAVAGHLGLTLPAVSRLINGLVAGGLVRRQTVSTNRRQVALTLTAKGQAGLEKVRSEIRRQLAGWLRMLSVPEQKNIRRAMRALHDVFGQQAGTEGKTGRKVT